MSLGIRSIWRPQSWCVGTPGASPAACSAAFHARAPLALYSKQSFEAAFAPPAAAPPSTHPKPESPPESPAEHTNHDRNQMLRDSFRVQSPVITTAVERKLDSPFVPVARDYPSLIATQKSMVHAQNFARVQVGFDIQGRLLATKTPDWAETFSLLKKMTPRRGEEPNMAAVRAVLPKSWDVAVGTKKVEYLESTTGLQAKLLVSASHKNPSAIVLRGQSSVLAKAVEELIAACKGVEIFRLGEVATLEYETKRLWPAIDGAPDGGGLSLPADGCVSIWAHKEPQTYWVDRPYEETPRPECWTKETFESYITTLVCGRLHPHLSWKFYYKHRVDGHLVDTNGVRVGLILDAFREPFARKCATPAALKMAMDFMAHRGGHRVSAHRLFAMAEEWGMPMDAETFNIILNGYVTKRDATFFHNVLQDMEERFFPANARTWLLFLALVQRDDERRQIMAAMYELGLVEDASTRRGIASVMAGYDAYTAFKAGKTLSSFMADQAARYGEDWFTLTALNLILKEFFLFHGRDDPRLEDFKVLMERQSEDGQKLDIGTMNIVLEYCAEACDWKTALWALSQLSQYGFEPNDRTYKFLISLACNARSPNALGVAFFYSVMDRKLRRSARWTMRKIFLGQHPIPFWKRTQPKVFSNRIAKTLEEEEVWENQHTGIVAVVERAILTLCRGYRPVKSLYHAVAVAFRTMDRPMHQQLKLRHRNPAQPFRVGDFAVKLRDPAGLRPRIIVHLDACFSPQSMVRRWCPEKDRPLRGPLPPEDQDDEGQGDETVHGDPATAAEA